MNKHIVVIGNVGVGKSTLTGLLEKKLPAKQVPADKLFQTNPFFPLAVTSRAKWSFTSDVWFLHERVKLAGEIEKSLIAGNVIVDSGLPMSYVYSHSRLGSGYFTDDEWELYKELYDALTKNLRDPDVVIYLHGSGEVLRKRIKNRGREHELKFYTMEYLESLDKSLETMVEGYEKKGMEVIKLDVAEVDFIKNVSDRTALIDRINRK